MPEMAQQQAASKPAAGQLAVQNSHNSSSCVFKPISSPGKLESLGLTPVPKVLVRPTGRKKKKPSALDKQYRHVFLLQRHNRRHAAQQAQQQAEQQRQQQELAEFSQHLRANILTGDADAVQQSWQPAAAAAALQEQQAAAAQQTRQLQSKLQGVYDLPHLQRSQPPQHCSATVTAGVRPGSRCSSPSSAAVAADAGCRHGSSGFSAAAGGPVNKPAEAAEQGVAQNDDNNDDEDDVDSFLDGLLQQAAAHKAGSSTSQAQHSSKGAAPAHHQPATSRPSTAGATAAAGQAGKQQQKGKAKPAWALSGQQQAEVAAAAAAAAEAAAAAAEVAEEAGLLQFAEGLSWEQIVGQLDDEQLAAAFQELDAAEQQASEGDPSAEKQWRRCFVTALNHAVMQGVSAAAIAAAVGAGAVAGSEAEQDRHSVASSASQVRKAEAIAAQRHKLLERLARIGGSSSGSRAGSVCNGGSHFGGYQGGTGSVSALGFGQQGFGGSAGGLGLDLNPGDGWDGSTRVGSNDVAVLTTALKALEAGEVLVENPEMRGVHSVASVRSMLQKAEAQK